MKKRVMYFDILNIVASFAVVAMHCNGIVHTYANTFAWKQSLVVEVLCYWAVPIFFMISGATLLEYRKKYTTKIFLKKRIEKTLIPFLLWSCIALFVKCMTGTISVQSLSVKIVCSMVMNCQIENVYWFFIPLFAVYLSMPVLADIVQYSQRSLIYMVTAGIVTISILPFICSLFEIPFNTAISFPLTGGYVLYSVLGYLLAKNDLSDKQRFVIYIGGLIGCASRYFGTYFLSIKNNELNKLFWGYLNWPALMLAIAVFVCFKSIRWCFFEENSIAKKLLSEITNASFGIYLIHIFVMKAYIRVFNVDIYGWKWRMAGTISVYITSLIIVKFMQRIPVFRKLVP